MEKQISNQPTVMCVDDDDLIRPFVGLVLRNAGFAVNEARTCAEAQQSLHSKTPTFVVLDIDLPDGNGFEMAEAWRNDGYGTLPILFISGGDSGVCQARAAQLKAGFLPKPFNMLDLLSAIHSVFSDKQRIGGPLP